MAVLNLAITLLRKRDVLLWYQCLLYQVHLPQLKLFQITQVNQYFVHIIIFYYSYNFLNNLAELPIDEEDDELIDPFSLETRIHETGKLVHCTLSIIILII